MLKKPLIIKVTLLLSLGVVWFWEANQTYRHKELRCLFKDGSGTYTLLGRTYQDGPALTLYSDAAFSFSKGFGINHGGVTYTRFPLNYAGKIPDLVAMNFLYDREKGLGRVALMHAFSSGSMNIDQYGWFSTECWQKVAAFRDIALPHVRLLTRNWPKDLEPIPMWKDGIEPFDIPVHDQEHLLIKDPELFE